MRELIKKLNLKDYLSKELLYITIAVLVYLIYNHFSFHTGVHDFIRTRIFGVEKVSSEEFRYYRLIIWFLTSFIYLFLIPFVLSLLIEGKKVWTKLGMTFGNVKKGFLITISLSVFMFICILVAINVFPEFREYYPMAKFAMTSIPLFIFYQISYFLYFLGWEFYFRSFLLFPYKEKFGKAGAVIIGVLPFVILHIGKPFPEVIGSFAAHIALCYLALETDSFWYAFLLHGLVAVFMDVAVMFF